MTDALEGVLAGIRVVDASRMIPGAVLARSLVALGADVVKLEDPRGGDPMRHMPPVRDGIGVGFATYYAGASSVTAQLGTDAGNAAVRALVRDADVFVESFRPGTLARWGLDPSSLREGSPRLVTVSLPGYPSGTAAVDDVAHDLNALARSGLLARLGPTTHTPRVQIADVTTGLLAGQAVLAALLLRARTGLGRHLEQPLAVGAMPFLLWPLADREASGAIGATEHLIGGRCAAYGVYRGSDGARLAVGCLEPKFWTGFCALLERPDLAAKGLAHGDAGALVIADVQRELARGPAAQWAARARDQGLPVDCVCDLTDAALPSEWVGPLLQHVPMPHGDPLSLPSRLLGDLERAPSRAAPRLGEHTATRLAACGASDEVISACTTGVATPSR
jgi:crotonobetainyl-CoA:carnitine CoA-transferase CaiB-like acyl-CoA transferase